MLYSANQTSARLLLEFAQNKWIDNNANADLQDHQRYLLLHDLYIKARSFSIINKVAFWFALLGGIAVVAWPMVAELFNIFSCNKDFLVLASELSKFFGCDTGGELIKNFFSSAVTQTTITAFAGLAFAIYSHYKKRQMFVENLMRSIVYAEDWEATMAVRVIKEIERIDSGFGFAETLGKKSKNTNEEN